MLAALLEKLAVKDTGRRVAHAAGKKITLVVMSSRVTCQPFMINDVSEIGSDIFLLSRDCRSKYGSVKFLAALIRAIRAADGIEIFHFSRRDIFCGLSAAIAGRLAGATLTLHDFGFRSGPLTYDKMILYSLSDRVMLADGELPVSPLSGRQILATRYDAFDIGPYLTMTKERAVPRVLVCADIEESRAVALAVRTCELVKQKYPRAEFILVTPFSENAVEFFPHQAGSAVTVRSFNGESDMASLFSAADILMILSKGGSGRMFANRASRAGYPIITNGFNLEGISPCPIVAVRDSYSSLAEAVIRLVDDDRYYRRQGGRP